MAELSGAERAELERLRRDAAAGGRWGRAGRWVAATLLLLIGAVSATAAVAAVYLQGQVLDTNTYVETVAPLGEDPTVRAAVAQRLTEELVTRTDLNGLATDLAKHLEAQGAPARVSDLVAPLVSGISSFLNDEINQLMATPRFETAWVNANRVAHQGLVTVLTGQEGTLLSTQGDTVNLDLGELLTLVKQKLVADGLTVFGKIPDVSVTYPLVQSDKLPTIQGYANTLDLVATWLPWAALALLLGGILVAPNRRRGIMLGAALTALAALLALGFLRWAQTYYVDHLPPQVHSAAAAGVVASTMLRYLVAALQTLVVVMLIAVVAAFLAGPSTLARLVRRPVNWGLDALGRLLARTGRWALATGRVLQTARLPLYSGLVLLTVVGLVLANRPGISTVVWTAVVVLLVLGLLEVFVRASAVRTRVV